MRVTLWQGWLMGTIIMVTLVILLLVSWFNPENRICSPSAALHEARNGVSHSIASCALQLGHSCGFQCTKWVAWKDS